MKNIILIGFQGVGKSFFGKKLGELLGRKWIDTDDLNIQEYEYRLTNKEIYLQLGEKGFRALEKRVLEGLVQVEGAIISTGAGVVELANHKNLLHGLGRVLYLKEEFEVLKERQDRATRVVLQNQSLEEMYRRRDTLYKKVAHEQLEAKWDQILLADSLQSLLLESHMEKG